MNEGSRRPMVSIIMPVYKVEDYVGRAVESIRNQTFHDWELWAVDDGSPDKSGEICDKYALNDSRIHVIHKENGGAPSARNAAMEQASGKYYYFMDSDDWAEKEMLEDMVCCIERNQSQLLIAGFYIDTYYSDEAKHSQIRRQPSQVFETQRQFREEAYRLFDFNLLYTPWNKLYLAEYLRENEIIFPKTFWDDFPFNLRVIKDIEKVCVTEKAYYHFIRKRAESETARYNPAMYDKREQENQWMRDLYTYWDVNDQASQEMISRRYIERLVGCVENVTNTRCSLSRKEKAEKINEMISAPQCREALKTARPKSLMMKLMLFPFRIKSKWLTYLEGRFITWIKENNTRLFAKLKAER